MQRPDVGGIYQKHFNGHRRERLFLSSIGFFVAFATVRAITHAIRRHVGPFHDVERKGLHFHHLIWGIFTLLGVGYLWLAEIGTGVEGTSVRTSRLTSLLYGAGAALTLDEFALWLYLEDVYWAKQGRDSVDAAVLFASILSVGWWGGPFIHEVTRESARVLKHNVRHATGKE